MSLCSNNKTSQVRLLLCAVFLKSDCLHKITHGLYNLLPCQVYTFYMTQLSTDILLWLLQTGKLCPYMLTHRSVSRFLMELLDRKYLIITPNKLNLVTFINGKCEENRTHAKIHTHTCTHTDEQKIAGMHAGECWLATAECKNHMYIAATPMHCNTHIQLSFVSASYGSTSCKTIYTCFHTQQCKKIGEARSVQQKYLF